MRNEIRFEDIRKGDRIKTEWTTDDTESARTGVVSIREQRVGTMPTAWYTAAGRRMTGFRDDTEKYYLLERPKPPAPPTTPGSVIVATEVRGVKGEWRMLAYIAGDGSGPVEYISERSIRDFIWHRPEHITEWKPATVTADE